MGYRRLKYLDGFRGLSILLVLFGHLVGTKGFPVSVVTSEISQMAHLGVRIFFVISGYIITLLAMREHSANGRISLARFYLRRSLRIFPPFYLYVLCVSVLAFLGVVNLSSVDALAAATYVSNFKYVSSWVVAHSWSLSVEEQFYIIWPSIIVLAGWKRAAWAAFLFVLLLPVTRVLVGITSHHLYSILPTDADAIATGCVLALQEDRIRRSPICGFLIGKTQLVALIGVLVAGVAVRNSYCAFIFLQLSNVAVAVLILAAGSSGTVFVGNMLSAPVLASLGRVSYSLYLWQQVFLDRSVRAWYASFPMNIILAICMGCASFVLIEMPSQKIRKRFESQDPGDVSLRSRGLNASVPASSD